jgi:hypothetical protein
MTVDMMIDSLKRERRDDIRERWLTKVIGVDALVPEAQQMVSGLHAHRQGDRWVRLYGLKE